MAKIVSMSSGAIDPIAQSKRVFFRPTAADTVRVGDLVCYNWDIARDHKERASDPTHLGLTQHTYAQGAQDYTGRLFIVEKPTTANLQFFAGVVKALGPKAGADNDMIEIWVPNGAVLPVMIDQDTVEGRTIVAVRDGAYEGSYPSSSARPIGIAMETVTANTTDALCWVKVDPNMFAWQYHSSGLLVDDEITTNTCHIHKIHVGTNQTGGQFHPLYIRGDLLADCTGHTEYGMVQIEEYLAATALGGNSSALGVAVQMSTGLAAAAGHEIHAAILGIEDWAGVAKANMVLSVLKLESYISGTGTAPAMHTMMQFNTNTAGDTPDYWFWAQNRESIACTYDPSGDENATKVGDIKIHISGPIGTGYIRVYDGVS